MKVFLNKKSSTVLSSVMINSSRKPMVFFNISRFHIALIIYKLCAHMAFSLENQIQVQVQHTNHRHRKDPQIHLFTYSYRFFIEKSFIKNKWKNNNRRRDENAGDVAQQRFDKQLSRRVNECFAVVDNYFFCASLVPNEIQWNVVYRFVAWIRHILVAYNISMIICH